MPWRVHHGERQSAEPETLTLEKPLTRHFITLEREPIRGGLKRPGLEHRDIGLVKVHGDVEVLAQRLHGTNVIEVGVRQPDGPQSDPDLFYSGDQPNCVIARIDQRRVEALAIPHEVRVFLKRAGLERDDLERWRGHADNAASRRAARNFSAAMAAVVASPTAVVTCRVS